MQAIFLYLKAICQPLFKFDSVIPSFDTGKSRFTNSPLLNVDLELNVVILSPNTVSDFRFSGPNTSCPKIGGDLYNEERISE